MYHVSSVVLCLLHPSKIVKASSTNFLLLGRPTCRGESLKLLYIVTVCAELQRYVLQSLQICSGQVVPGTSVSNKIRQQQIVPE